MIMFNAGKLLANHAPNQKGSLVRLTGQSSAATIPDDPPSDRRFPHHRCPWQKPGLGASVGLSGCEHVSATSCAYIVVDTRRYMLTVDHFITEARCGCRSTGAVLSPSICDILDVREQLRWKLSEVRERMRQSTQREVPLDRVVELLNQGDVQHEYRVYERFEREANQDFAHFAFGQIIERCGGSQKPMRISINPGSDEATHRMDWSLTEVTQTHRMGKNLFRFSHGNGPPLADLRQEIMRPEGTGVSCVTAGDVVAGEHVYYVGTTSGYRECVVNPGRILYDDGHGNVSEEWGMVVAGCEQLGDDDFKGDSGALVVSQDHRGLAILWGWDNGSILITPIKDVFADIAQKMNTTINSVKFLEDSGSRSNGTSKLLCRISGNANVFKRSTERAPTYLESTPSPASSLSPQAEEKKARRRSSGASSTWSMASTPSLTSLVSSLADDTPRAPTPDHVDRAFSHISGTPKFNIVLPFRPNTQKRSEYEHTEDWVVLQRGAGLDAKLSSLHLGVPCATA